MSFKLYNENNSTIVEYLEKPRFRSYFNDDIFVCNMWIDPMPQDKTIAKKLVKDSIDFYQEKTGIVVMYQL
ncbi:MAG TPA: hypothetical protein PLH91_00575 [Tenuifilaceae bacterium]|nr:hypothetical protein [Tenuifilaceae bacterium]